MLNRYRWIIIALWLGSLTACAAPAAPTTTSAPVPATSVPVAATSVPTLSPTNTSSSTAATSAPTRAFTATSAAAGLGAKVPNSCNDLVSLVGTYMGGVATTKSLGSPQHLSCEYANANTSTIIVVNIGVGGTAANFAALKSSSAQGGRTVTSVSGLGSEAFSVSKNNVPAGLSVLSAQGLIYVVNSNLPIAQDQTLMEQLMKLP